MSGPPRTVWAVIDDGASEGGYRVVGVFESREDADQVAAGLGSHHDVEQFALYAAGEGANFRSHTTCSAQVIVFRDGSASSSGITEWDRTEFEHAPIVDAVPRVRVYGVLAKRPVSRHKDKWTINVEAATAQAARDALAERLNIVVDHLGRGVNPETGEPLPPETRHPDTLTEAEVRAYLYRDRS